MAKAGAVERDSGVPVFRQIAEQFRAAIRSGELVSGDQLPSESQLMEEFGVARMTVRNALSELIAEGLVVPERGRGVFVRARPPVRRLASDRFARRHRERGLAAFSAETEHRGEASVDQFECAREHPTARTRELLGLRPRTKVVARRRRYLLGRRVVARSGAGISTRWSAGRRSSTALVRLGCTFMICDTPATSSQRGVWCRRGI